MTDDRPSEPADLALVGLGAHDLYTLSVDDLNLRISALKAEIERCETALAARDDTKAAAERLFRF